MVDAMMTLYKCGGCFATYPDSTPDGAIYAHACAPITDQFGNQIGLRPGHRDENIILRRDGTPANIRSEGAGAIAVSTGKAAEPAWITATKAVIAKSQ